MNITDEYLNRELARIVGGDPAELTTEEIERQIVALEFCSLHLLTERSLRNGTLPELQAALERCRPGPPAETAH
jgi:hypothetical protein